MIARPFRKMTTSIRSLSLAQTSSMTEKIFCPYFFVSSGLKVVAGLVYIRSSWRLEISMPCFSTSIRLPLALVVSALIKLTMVSSRSSLYIFRR